MCIRDRLPCHQLLDIASDLQQIGMTIYIDGVGLWVPQGGGVKRYLVYCLLIVVPAALVCAGCASSSADFKAEYPAASGTVIDTVFYTNGIKKAERTLLFGVPTGTSTTWFVSGQKRSEINLEHGEKDGLEIMWWETGRKMSECTYKAGKKNGSLKEWNQKGQPQLDYTYFDDMLEGPYTAWWNNGQKRAEGMYSRVQRVGLCREWDAKGELLLEVDYPMPDRPAGAAAPWTATDQGASSPTDGGAAPAPEEAAGGAPAAEF